MALMAATLMAHARLSVPLRTGALSKFTRLCRAGCWSGQATDGDREGHHRGHRDPLDLGGLHRPFPFLRLLGFPRLGRRRSSSTSRV